MIVIAIVGCWLLYGINYGLNDEVLVDNNLYRYNIVGNQNLLDMKIDGEKLYYLLSDNKIDSDGNTHYSFIKYDLSNNNEINKYEFINNKSLTPIEIVKNDNDWYLVSFKENIFYHFDKNLEFIEKDAKESVINSTHGLYNKKNFTVVDNNVYYGDKVYDTLPKSCGSNQKVIYSNKTYLRFYNYEKKLGCLYNMNNKNIYYLDYDGIDVVNGKYLEYQNNSLKFRFDNREYYFNDISENNNLKMHVNGDYLLTYDNSSKTFRIYNLEANKVVYSLTCSSFKDNVVSLINIDNYAYFKVVDGKTSYIYIWDYLKSNRLNKDMITLDSKEYRFKNDKVIDEIKEKYDIDILTYDNAVQYFSNFYVIPSYDDVLINTRLVSLLSILENFDMGVFRSISSRKNIYLYLDNDVFDAQDERISYKVLEENNKYLIIINMTDDNFQKNILYTLMRILELNMNNLYREGRISEPFKNWNNLNYHGFNYTGSYHTILNNGYLIGSSNAYFIDNLSKCYAYEDRAKIFANVDNEEILSSPNLINKAKYLKDELVKAYPLLVASKHFQLILK